LNKNHQSGEHFENHSLLFDKAIAKIKSLAEG
jgi:hypothetical protein